MPPGRAARFGHLRKVPAPMLSARSLKPAADGVDVIRLPAIAGPYVVDVKGLEPLTSRV